jgi:hypothetical protein
MACFCDLLCSIKDPMTPCHGHPWPRKWLRIAPRSLSEWSMVVSFGTCRLHRCIGLRVAHWLRRRFRRKTWQQDEDRTSQTSPKSPTPTLVWRVDIKHGYTVWIYKWMFELLTCCIYPFLRKLLWAPNKSLGMSLQRAQYYQRTVAEHQSMTAMPAIPVKWIMLGMDT